MIGEPAVADHTDNGSTEPVTTTLTSETLAEVIRDAVINDSAVRAALVELIDSRVAQSPAVTLNTDRLNDLMELVGGAGAVFCSVLPER